MSDFSVKLNIDIKEFLQSWKKALQVSQLGVSQMNDIIKGIKPTADFSEIEKELEDTIDTLNKISNPHEIKITTQNSEKNIDALNKRLATVPIRFAEIGLAIDGFQRVAGLIGRTAAPFISYERNLANVNTLVDISTEKVQAYGQKIIDMSGRVGEAATELTANFYEVISAGVDVNQAVDFLEEAAIAAKAGITETRTAVDGLTSVLNAYQLDISNTSKISDLMFQTVNRGKITFDELARQIADVTPLAAASGVKFEELSGAIATVTKQGIRAPIAMTNIRMAMVAANEKLGDGWAKTMTFQDAMQKLFDMAEGSPSKLRTLVGSIEAVQGVLSLAGNNADMAQKDLTAMFEATGVKARAFALQSQTVDFAIKQLKAGFNSLLIETFQLLKPILTTTVKLLNTVIKGFNDMPVALKIATVSFTLMAVAVRSYNLAIVQKTATETASVVSTNALSIATGVLTGAVTRLSLALKGLHASMGIIGWILAGISIAIPIVTHYINKNNDATANAASAQNDYNNSLNKGNIILDDYTKRLKALSLQELKNEENRLKLRKKELNRKQSEIGLAEVENQLQTVAEEIKLKEQELYNHKEFEAKKAEIDRQSFLNKEQRLQAELVLLKENYHKLNATDKAAYDEKLKLYAQIKETEARLKEVQDNEDEGDYSTPDYLAEWLKIEDELTQARLSETEKIEAEYAKRLAVAVNAFSVESDEFKTAQTKLNYWRESEHKKLNDRLTEDTKKAREKEVTDTRSAFETELKRLEIRKELNLSYTNELQKVYANYSAWLKQVYGENSLEYLQSLEQQVKATEAAKKEEERLFRENHETLVNAFSVTGSMGKSAFETLLSSGKSFSEKMSNIFSDLKGRIIGFIGDIIQKWIETSLIELALHRSTETAKTAVTAEQETVRAGIHKTNVLQAIALDIWAGIKFVAIKLWEVAASMVKFFSFLGPFAPLAAGGVMAGVVAMVNSFKKGFASGGYTGDGGMYEPAGYVHKGEVVFEKRIVKNNLAELLGLRSLMQKGVTLKSIIPTVPSLYVPTLPQTSFATGGYAGKALDFSGVEKRLDALINKVSNLQNQVIFQGQVLGEYEIYKASQNGKKLSREF